MRLTASCETIETTAPSSNWRTYRVGPKSYALELRLPLPRWLFMILVRLHARRTR